MPPPAAAAAAPSKEEAALQRARDALGEHDFRGALRQLESKLVAHLPMARALRAPQFGCAHFIFMRRSATRSNLTGAVEELQHHSN